MKKLELNQMENLEGGSPATTCGLAVIGSIGFGIAIATMTFPVGTLAMAGWMASGFAVGGSWGSCAYEATH